MNIHDHNQRHRNDDRELSRVDAARWLALVDCCRPGSEDAFEPAHGELAPLAEQLVADPAVQELYERGQQWDAAFRSAVVDESASAIPIPVGLAARMLASMAETAPVDRENSECENSESESAESVTPAPAPAHARGDRRSHERFWRPSRRSALGWALAASLIGVLGAVGYGIIGNRWSAVEWTEVAEESRSWMLDIRQKPEAWNDDMQRAPRALAPLDQQVSAAPRRWRSISTSHGTESVVYDLRGPGQDRLALLFVVRTSRDLSRLPTSPPITEPQSRTDGVVTGIWSRPNDDLLYVLVVEGPLERFREFVRAQRLAHAGGIIDPEIRF